MFNHKALPFILIIVLGLVVYANSLNGRFVWDDEVLVNNNIFIKSFTRVAGYFTKSISDNCRYFYRPLQMITYAADYSIWKYNVIGYHLTSILLHILVSIAVFQLVDIIYDNKKLALLTSSLFVIHPIHTEAVSYISGRATVLAALFMLSCFIIYIRQLRQPRINLVGYAGLVLTFAFSLFSKESSLILPILLLFYHFIFNKKIKPLEFFSLSGIVVLYIIARLTFLKSMLPDSSFNNILERIPGFFAAIASYVRLLFLPFPLHMEYGSKIFKFTDARVIAGIAITLLCLVIAYIKRNNKYISFSIGWFFIALIPVSNIYKINAFMAEGFIYLPSIGFFILMGYFVNTIYSGKRFKLFSITLTVCFVLFYSILTIRQNFFWKEPLALYERTLKFAPGSARIYSNLGNTYYETGEYVTAMLYYTKAIELDPELASAYQNRAIVYHSMDKYEKAMSDYNMAIKLNPEYAEAYNNMGNIYMKYGNFDKAIFNFNKAIEIKPYYAQAYNNRGLYYAKLGNYTGACKDLSKAIGIDPDNGIFYNNRAISCYYAQGDYGKCRDDIRKAQSLGYKVDADFLKMLAKNTISSDF